MKIIVDAMGGDFAPHSNVRGAIQGMKEYGVDIVLVGRGEEILRVLKEDGYSDLPKGVEIVHAEEVIEICDNPATAFKDKPHSSMTMGLNLLKEGGGDAFVSAGSTGALLSASILLVKRIRHIRRPAIAPVVPTGCGGSLLIDCGATAEGTPEYLLQYAFMGSYYAEKVMGRPKPRVGLLNIGAEESKGTDLQKETLKLLKQAGEEGRLHFIGNIESNDAVLGKADVIVSDGYAGNIFLKALEGTARYLGNEMKAMFSKNWMTKLGYLCVKDGMAKIRKLGDPHEVGGTPFLGVSKPVIKAHGSSNDHAIKNAVRQAKAFAGSGFIQEIEKNIDAMRLPSGKESESL